MKNYVKVLGLLSMGAMMWGATQAATLTVSSAGLYQEVDAAIAAANNGDTISVTPDKVYAPFTVNKIGLTFSGNGSIIDGNWTTGTAITISASNTTIEGFEVRNIKGYGISTKDTDTGLIDIIISGNNVHDIDGIKINGQWQYPSGVGIFVGNMSGFFIYGDNGYRLLQSGLQTTELTYNGLIIDNNTVSNTTEGISILSITSSPAAQITNNTLDVLVGDHNGAGFWIDSSSNIDIIGNEVNGGYYGAIVTSYVANQPWEEWDTVGSSNIHIQNNIFNGAASVERYDGAGVAIYGSQVGSITISGNNLDNNANVGVLGAFTGPGTLDARYNYFGNSTPILVKVIAYINRARTPQATVGTIDNDPYYYTADHVRNITGAVSTGDNEATLEFTLTEILSNSTFVGGSLTLGTGTNMTGIAGVALTTGDNVTGGDMGYVVSNLFTGLDVGEYNYAVEYSTSEGTGSLTGSFEIPLVAYGCRDMWVNPEFKPYIWFNTNISNIYFWDPGTTEPDMILSGNGYKWDSPIAITSDKIFTFDYFGDTKYQTLTINSGSNICQ